MANEALQRDRWSILRWVVVGVVLDWAFWLLVGTVTHVPSGFSEPFEFWYGNWGIVVRISVLFTVFLLTFARPRRRIEWRNLGLYSAFLISLFTEMFGVPLTIYLIAPFLGLPSWAFGFYESHLWAFALDRLGLVPLRWGVYAVMAVSVTLVGVGASLVAIGWATVYRGRDTLVTHGIYAYLRHPQYLGLVFIVVGFNIQWPTVLTLLMAPILVVMYVRLARREDRELAAAFGQAFLDYAAQTPAFVRWGRSRRDARRLADSGGAPSIQAAVTTSVTSPE